MKKIINFMDKFRYVYKKNNKYYFEFYYLNDIPKMKNKKGMELISIDKFTTINDKNGVDIYENDYCRIEHSYWNNPIILISWEGGGKFIRPGFNFMPAISEEMIEKVGNWWENHKELEEGVK